MHGLDHPDALEEEFEVSRARAKPNSSIMNPACMKKTMKAVINTHVVFSGLMTSSAPPRAHADEASTRPLGTEVPRQCPRGHEDEPEPDHLPGEVRTDEPFRIAVVHVHS
jgi:hypothetical protein